MDIFGIGFPELLFIFVIALMVFGPRRLPEMARQAGKIVAELRKMSQTLMAEWQRELEASELQTELNKTKTELTQARNMIVGSGQAIAQQTAAITNTIAPPPANPADSTDASPGDPAQEETSPQPAASAPDNSPDSDRAVNEP